MTTLLILLVMVLLLLAQGFFSGSEIALVNADKLKLRHLASKGHKGAKRVLKMFEQPEVLLGTTLVGTNVSLVALTTLGTLLMIQLFGRYGDLIAFLFYTPLFLIFGEVVPKSVYQQKADQLAPRIIFPLHLFSLLFYPVVWIFSHLARLIVRLVGVKPSHHSPFMTRDQVRMMVESAEQASNVDVFDRDRLLRAIKFAESTVGEVMTPIAEVTMLSHHQSCSEAINIARKHGYFRLPVYEDEPGQIIGVVALNIWDLMDPGLSERPLADLWRPVLYVAENQPLDELLAELQQRDDHMAIVVDEFGSAIGMVTLEGLLEQVLGEVVSIGYTFEAHLPKHRAKIERLGDGRYRIDGRVLLSDLFEELGIPISYPHAHTIGGLLMKQLRHLPRPEESVSLSGYRFTVESVTERSVKSIIVMPE
ncbi:MAG: hemolysin family protein [Gammaproteobacteria bacterium]|nr:hemolysin family protein [Gammaproteobacteria bacterium]MCW8992775.1 hemolysin family protein [Gammaproteobacteria bacterium]